MKYALVFLVVLSVFVEAKPVKSVPLKAKLISPCKVDAKGNKKLLEFQKKMKCPGK